MRFYTKEVLGPKQRLTPEGFLLCEEVPLARTGVQLYTTDEVPIDPDPNTGLVNIERLPEDVFRDETIASANGKPVVDEHPGMASEDGMVHPDNWNKLARGVVLHPRRGRDAQGDMLLADLLITNADAIEAVRAGKREVSCGYDVEYTQLAPGLGRQTDIMINHVALVESGRCGSRCRIYDHETVEDKESIFMHVKEFRDKLTALFTKDKRDPKELDGLLAEAFAGRATHDGCGHDAFPDEEERKKAEDARVTRDKAIDTKLEAMDASIKGIKDSVEELKKSMDEKAEEEKKAADKRAKDAEAEKEEAEKKAADAAAEENLEKEAPPGTGDKARKAKDSMFLVDSFQQTMAMAEILAPGVKVPQFDQAAAPRASFDAICTLRRKALLVATQDSSTLPMLEKVMALDAGDPEEVREKIRALDCAAARTTFFAVAGMKAQDNNTRRVTAQAVASTATSRNTEKGWAVETPGELSKKLAAHYGQN